ncbi:fibrinogen-like protein 1 [Drosophila tropicalis]|uniref:fibrinogen-like protein 1 n=1 Tax=Drosophila tropicalis TaxID=46794 RepID=UPI0035ABF2B1
MEDFNGNVKTVGYDNFRIGNNESKYLLESLGTFNGTAANIMELNRKFSTWDSNNDYRLHSNCAEEYSGGWWYTYFCDKTNLNGRYYENGIFKPDSMTWNGWDVLKSVQMLIRQHSSDVI